MKRKLIGLATAAVVLLPQLAAASHEVNVNVDVRVARGGSHCDPYDVTWVDFRPDRGAFVALYAAYSDGSVQLVFPREEWRNHWVEPRPGCSVPLQVPRGLRLESVQAVASRRWFDPQDCWVTVSAPRGHRGCDRGHHGDCARGPVVVTTCGAPLFTWSFEVAWGASHRSPRIRTGCRTPLRVVPTGRDAAHPRTDRWSRGDGSGPGSRVKVKAVSGTRASKSRWQTGEPKRRSRR